MNDSGARWYAKTRNLWLAGILLILVLAVYAPVRNFDYTNYDDPVYVTLNRHVTGGLSLANVTWAFTTSHGANWFPLTWLSLMADCQFFGAGAGSQHVTNVLLHALSTVLLFILLVEMTGASFPSAAVAFLFALHPQHVESVAWVAERKDVLSTVFWMLAIWSYARYAARPSAGTYLRTLVLFCLGFLAKPMVVTFPVILILLDVWPLQRLSLAPGEILKRRTILPQVREKLPFFVLAAIMAGITVAAQHSGGAVQSLDAFPLPGRLANALRAGALYIGKTFWPTGLGVFYPMHTAPAAWQVIVASLVLLGLTALALLTVRTRPYLFAGWFWYLVTLLPVIGIVQVGEQSRADRYTYIPAVGLFLMLAWSVDAGWRRVPQVRLLWLGLIGAAAIACLVLTAKQLSYWRNSRMLFEHTLAVTTENEVAHGCLGEAYRSEGRMEEALVQYRQAIDIDPRYVAAMINYGSVLGLLGRTGEAIAPLSEAVRLKHDDVAARNAFGLALAMLGHLPEAETQFEAALFVDPESVMAHISLGNTLANLGRLDEAITQFREALALDPTSQEASANLQKAQSMLNGGTTGRSPNQVPR